MLTHPPALTTDAYGNHFGTNRIGHVPLIKLLLPTMLKTAEKPEKPGADVRIVSITSPGFSDHPSNCIDSTDVRTTYDTPLICYRIHYGKSKLANILYASEVAPS